MSTIVDTEDEREIKYGVSKYKNIMGITCYMNSILHILQQLPIFTEYITQAKFKDSIISKIENQLKSKHFDNKEAEYYAKEELLKKYVIFELKNLKILIFTVIFKKI